MTAPSLSERRYVAFPPHTGFLALPRASPASARAGLALYEAVGPRQQAMTWAVAVLLRGVLHRLLPSHPGTGIDWDWWDSWLRDVGAPTLGGPVHVTIRSRGTNRRSAALFTDDRGRPLAFVKRHADGLSELSIEVRRRLDAALCRHVRTPRTIHSGTWQSSPFDVFEPLPPGRHHRPPHRPDLVHAVIDEIHEALADTPRPDHVPDHHVVCHTGFTPRNLRVTGDGTWWVVDWDNVRWGPRLVYELRYWTAERAYRWRVRPDRDAPEVLQQMLTRGSAGEILEAIHWPGHVDTYRLVEGDIYRGIARLLAGEG